MPNKRLKAADVTDHLRDQLCEAEEVWLVDPAQGMGAQDKHTWMELIVSVPPQVPEGVDPSTPKPDPVILEIEIDSTDQAGWVEVREKIKRICGQTTIEAPRATGVA